MTKHPLTITVVTALMAAVSCTTNQAQPDADRDLITQGEKLVRLGGCADCHTPMSFDPKLGMPVPQPSRALSGHPEGGPDPSAAPGAGDQAVVGPTFTSFRTPFGVVYSANLTPDRDTGMGRWSAAQFIAAVRSGKHQGNEAERPILPPMPWANIGGNSDDDLRAMFRYLQSIPAIKNQVSEPKVSKEALQTIANAYALAARKAQP